MTESTRPFGEVPDLGSLFLPPAKGRHTYFKDNGNHPFDAATTAHSPANAWWLAECSLLAYEEPADLPVHLEQQPFFKAESLVWFETPGKSLKHNTQGFCIASDDCAVIAFRGTEFPRPSLSLDYLRQLGDMFVDIRTDLTAMPQVPGPPHFPVRIHSGIAGELQEPALWGQIAHILDRLAGKRLWLTGHSLGGALATLLAFILRDQVAGVYTYGALPVGGQDFLKVYAQRGLQDRTYRYVHGNDPAPRLFALLGDTYVHVGRTLQLPVGDRGWLSRLGLDRLGAAVHFDALDHHPLFYCHETWNCMTQAVTT